MEVATVGRSRLRLAKRQSFCSAATVQFADVFRHFGYILTKFPSLYMRRKIVRLPILGATRCWLSIRAKHAVAPPTGLAWPMTRLSLTAGFARPIRSKIFAFVISTGRIAGSFSTSCASSWVKYSAAQRSHIQGAVKIWQLKPKPELRWF